MDRWQGKVAVVTGASSGIGAAIAFELVKKGLKVVGVARRTQPIENLKKIVKGPGELHVLRCDVNREDEIQDVFDWVEKRFGAVHVLVNNAGIIRPGSFIDQDPKLFREVLNTNVMGLSICTQKALKLMTRAKVDNGHIININSILGHGIPSRPDGPTGAMYPSSKHAVTALTEIIRQELTFKKSGTRITSISPGLVATEIAVAAVKTAGKSAADLADSMKEAPILQPKDIADAVVYVLSTPPHVVINELTIRPLGAMY